MQPWYCPVFARRPLITARAALRKTLLPIIVLVTLAAQPSLALVPSSPPPETEAIEVTGTLGDLPLRFAENLGQWDSAVRFKARASEGELFATREGVLLTMPCGGNQAHRIRLSPLKARPGVEPRAGQKTGTKMHYFLGSDRSRWRTGVPTYESVVYDAIYPGIDLRYHGDNRALEYDFLVAPGADPKEIRMRLEGAGSVRLDSDGSMIMTFADGRELRQAAPVIYQESEGRRTMVAGAFRLKRADGDQHAYEFGFDLAGYDPSRPLVIDPTLTYSTFLGGADNDYAYAVTTRTPATGGPRAVVAGTTFTTDTGFPSGTLLASTVQGGGDIFVSRFAADGAALEYSVIIGGSKADVAKAVTVNETTGAVYVTGHTLSTDFPVESANWPTLNGSKQDAFILGLTVTEDGVTGDATDVALSFATYYGGAGSDFGASIALDSAGSVYVAGTTDSTDLSVKNALYPTCRGGIDGFLLKMNKTGTILNYATYFGGLRDDAINALVVSPGEHIAYIAGSTLSTDLPVTGYPVQSAIGSALKKDGFVARIDTTSSNLIFSTYLGGAGDDWINGMAGDSAGNLVITGATNSTNFPTVVPIQPSLAAGFDAFLAKLDVSGRFLHFSTYLGGSAADVGNSVAVDQYGVSSTGVPTMGSDFIYVGGQSFSNNLPSENAWTVTTSAGVLQSGYGYRGGGDGFVAKFDPAGLRMVYANYIGGTAADSVNGVATPVNSTGGAYPEGNMQVYVTGHTELPLTTPTGTSEFPSTTGALVTTPAGKADAFAISLTDTSYSADVPTLALGKVVAAPLTTSLTMDLTYTNSTPASPISAVATTLEFDPNVLAFLRADLGPVPNPSRYTINMMDYGNGRVYIIVYQSSGVPATLPAGVVAKVTFQVKYNGGLVISPVDHTPEATVANGPVGNMPSPIIGIPGLVQIIPRCSRLGDCDCSGTVRLWEVQQAVHMSLGNIPQTYCVMADYATMTASDLQQIINNNLFMPYLAATSIMPEESESSPEPFSGQAEVSPAASLTMESTSVNNTTLTVPLRLSSGGQQIAALMSNITYDPAQFSTATVAAGSVAADAEKSVMLNIVEPGKLRVVVVGMNNRQSLVDGEVATITLQAAKGKTLKSGMLSIASTAASPDAFDVPIAGNEVSYSVTTPLPTQPMLLPALQLLMQE